MSVQSRICLVLLVGIPASGKTYFRVFLENYLKSNFNTVLGCVKIFSICYDNFFGVRTPYQLSDDKSWKNERLNVLKIVKNIVSCITECNCEQFSELLPNVKITNESIGNPDSCLVLIDDNMYYSSMRYEYYKLAKEYNVSFSQIYFHVELEKALEMNSKRCSELQIPENIIETMFHKLESPDKSHSWETNSELVSSYADLQNKCVLNTILLCIKNALENPVQVIQADIQNKNEARQITQSNALHQIDNILKRLVGIVIKNEMVGSEKSKVPLISQEYSVKRHTLLKRIREGSIIIPVDLSEPIDNKKLNELEQFLSKLLVK